MYRNRLSSVSSGGIAVNVLCRLQSTHSHLHIKAYCDLLGVPIHASEAKIKQAFYKKSLQHHPDKNPGNESSARLFGEINEAYQALLLNNRENQHRTSSDFSNRWKFKPNTFRQWHKPKDDPARTASTMWKDDYPEMRERVGHEFTLMSKDMSNTWYGTFYKNMVAEDFERHKQLREKQDDEEKRDGICVVM